MSARILVVHDDRYVLALMVGVLFNARYDVVRRKSCSHTRASTSVGMPTTSNVPLSGSSSITWYFVPERSTRWVFIAVTPQRSDKLAPVSSDCLAPGSVIQAPAWGIWRVLRQTGNASANFFVNRSGRSWDGRSLSFTSPR